TDLNNGEIAQLAYLIWEREGRPEGRSLDHWLMAEEKLHAQKPVQNSARNEQSSVVAPAAPPIISKRQRPRQPVFTHRPSPDLESEFLRHTDDNYYYFPHGLSDSEYTESRC